MFKKTLGLWMAFMMIFSLAACGQAAPGQQRKHTFPMNPPPGVKRRNHRQQKLPKRKHPRMTGKTLVVYFSWSGTTEEMASYIAEQTGADLVGN